MEADSVLTTHYAQVPSVYHDSWFSQLNGPFEKWQLELIATLFGKQSTTENWNSREEVLLDLGCGSGYFTAKLANELSLSKRPIGVDFSQHMLKIGQANDPWVQRVHSGAYEYLKESPSENVELILLKELIHHIRELEALFVHLHRVLKNNGRCLIVTRPKHEIDYPFFSEARRVWEKNQPDARELVVHAQNAGFGVINVKIHTIPVSIPFDRWTSMIENRFWSTFSEFADNEIENGIQEIHLKNVGDCCGNIHFEERMILIELRK